MNNVRLSLTGFAALITLSALSGCHRGDPEPQPGPPVALDPSDEGYEPPLWVAPPTAVKSLAAAVPIGDCTVQPPVGYVLTVTHKTAKPLPLTQYAWRSPKLPDGTNAILNVVIRKVSMAPFDASPTSLANWLGKRITDYLPVAEVFDAEAQTHNGLDCAAVFWKGATKSGDKHRHGFIYVYRSASEVIEFDGAVSDANMAPALSTLQASALSLQKP